MMDREEFDTWAGSYDVSVARCAAADQYPFAGYDAVLDTIFTTVRRKHGAAVLDLGFGTGALTRRLYDAGHPICGVDFSEKMVAMALEKMPDATLLQYDFSQGLPSALSGKQFDCILSTYAIHHLGAKQQTAFLKTLLSRLLPNGVILIGDVAFRTRTELEVCRREAGKTWDANEYYPVFDELRSSFPKAAFRKLSRCAGVITIPAS